MNRPRKPGAPHKGWKASVRYYCRGADGPNGHCDDRPMTIQCDHCIWTEDQARRGNYEDRIKNNE